MFSASLRFSLHWTAELSQQQVHGVEILFNTKHGFVIVAQNFAC